MDIRNYEYQSEFAREYFQKGVEKGRLEALELLVHQFERRLRRALTDAERSTLIKRLGSEGSARVGDVILDLSPEQLAAWLSDTTNS
ncbi:hypothetical protein [Polyangium aurulentum]|uniref:hypothetical protein n=1 Tax=Polyangium aurulentum TaxID=2567896 RepID=UPI0010AEB07F|nr:hypothetical protein [Polyangium aurulentum]UQA59139.1 hypothetical protein E8A73_001060 [Polyangium aurulentum]